MVTKTVPTDKAKKSALTEGESPFEAFKPEIIELQGDDALIRACDGEQTYLWLVTRAKGAKTFKVCEVYPGLAKKKTELRDATDDEDLVFTGRYKTIDEAREALNAALFEDFSDCDEASAEPTVEERNESAGL